MNRQNLDRLIAYIRQNQHFDMSQWSTFDHWNPLDEHKCASPCCIGGTCTYLLEGHIKDARDYVELRTPLNEYHSGGYIHHTRTTADFLEIDLLTAEKLCDPEANATLLDEDEEDEDSGTYDFHWPWDHLDGHSSNDSVTPEQAIDALEKVWWQDEQARVA